MNLTKLTTARISADMAREIKSEVRRRKVVGQRINEADIVREALIEFFQRKQAQQHEREEIAA